MSPLLHLFACLLTLFVAMGVGRFTLTPQLPHLIAEGQVDLTGAGLLAAANYLGYLLGALDALRADTPARAGRRLFAGLWGCVALSFLSTWAEGLWAHGLLRFASGVASAWALVVAAGISQQVALQAGQPRRGALVFTGPSLGVLVTGLIALALNHYRLGSAAAWTFYGCAGLAAALLAHPLLPRPRARPHPPRTARSLPPGLRGLLGAYGLSGLGYIIPATFLSQLAASRFHGAWQADLFWPCFGLAAFLGVLLASLRRPTPGGTLRWLVCTLWLQAAGALACLLPGTFGLALGVALSGGPFLAGTQLTLQYARELDPDGHTRNIGLLTAAFALGQLCGPLLAACSSRFTGGLDLALWVAGAVLLVASLLVRRPGAASRAEAVQG
ncbi:MFS transporter [Pseudomonas sp. RIT-PI-AD]|uniref:MFS transporter n=1 Tax=Pseudomonas sp. RIT-PI-AD TaxID=3035294 RepID=UPI0021D7EA59|nr:MFS transporter [Pseudomonas sp. RIT-PI-AD]